MPCMDLQFFRKKNQYFNERVLALVSAKNVSLSDVSNAETLSNVVYGTYALYEQKTILRKPFRFTNHTMAMSHYLKLAELPNFHRPSLQFFEHLGFNPLPRRLSKWNNVG